MNVHSGKTCGWISHRNYPSLHSITPCSTMTGFKTFIGSCVYFHFHTDDGLSKNRNVCTYCNAHKIMKFITFALVFSFILCMEMVSIGNHDCGVVTDIL